MAYHAFNHQTFMQACFDRQQQALVEQMRALEERVNLVGSHGWNVGGNDDHTVGDKNASNNSNNSVGSIGKTESLYAISKLVDKFDGMQQRVEGHVGTMEGQLALLLSRSHGGDRVDTATDTADETNASDTVVVNVASGVSQRFAGSGVCTAIGIPNSLDRSKDSAEKLAEKVTEKLAGVIGGLDQATMKSVVKKVLLEVGLLKNIGSDDELFSSHSDVSAVVSELEPVSAPAGGSAATQALAAESERTDQSGQNVNTPFMNSHLEFMIKAVDKMKEREMHTNDIEKIIKDLSPNQEAQDRALLALKFLDRHTSEAIKLAQFVLSLKMKFDALSMNPDRRPAISEGGDDVNEYKRSVEDFQRMIDNALGKYYTQ